MSNGSPNAPKPARKTINAGGPLTAHASSIPSITTLYFSVVSGIGPTLADAPEYSLSGAATTNSPSGFNAFATTCRPGESNPSSFVTRIRINKILS